MNTPLLIDVMLYVTFLATIGGRDQQTLAILSLRQGARPSALLTGILASLVSVIIMIWLAGTGTRWLSASSEHTLAAMVLILAGIDALRAVSIRRPVEPTNSLGALALVLLVRQLTGAPCWMIFAVAVTTHEDWSPGLGGFLGLVIALALGWRFPESQLSANVLYMRRFLGVLWLIAALWFFSLN